MLEELRIIGGGLENMTDIRYVYQSSRHVTPDSSRFNNGSLYIDTRTC